MEQANRAPPLLPLSPHRNPPSYLPACRGNLPGAMPLQGAVESSTGDNDDQMQNAFKMEERDRADIARGFGMLSDAERRGVFSRVVELSQEIVVGDQVDSSPLPVDTVMLAMNLFGMYLGKTNIATLDALRSEEKDLLPGVCLFAAAKFEEDVRNVLPNLVKALAVDEGSWAHVKKQVVSLEWKMLSQTGFRLMTPTPVTFLHMFVARTVYQGALAQHSTPAVGATATNMACRWVAEGLGVDYMPSELAAAALYVAVLHGCGPSTAANVAVVTGCPLDCPRFLRLSQEVKSSADATTTNSAEAQVLADVKRDATNEAGDSDTEDITPLPSADVQDEHGGFFGEEQNRQVGHDERHTPSPDAWLVEVLSVDRRQSNNGHSSSRVGTATAMGGRSRLPSYLGGCVGEGAGSGTSEGASQQDPLSRLMTHHGESSIASQDASERTPPPDPGSQELVVAAPPSPEDVQAPAGMAGMTGVSEVAQVLRAQDARLSESGGNGSSSSRPFATQWASSSGRLLVPVDVDADYEVPVEARRDWVAVRHPAPLIWTRGGLLVPVYP